MPKDYPAICQEVLTSLLLHHRKASAESIASKLETFRRLTNSSRPGMFELQCVEDLMLRIPLTYIFESNSATAAIIPPLHPPPHPQTSLNASLPTQKGIFWQPQAAVLFFRYRNDFDEVEFLGEFPEFAPVCLKADSVGSSFTGQGGFGEVVKARNKLDNRFYAVRVIYTPLILLLDGISLRH